VYTLEAIPAAAAPAAGYAGPTVRVDVVQVPPAWDRIELLRVTGRGEWRIDDLDQWAAPLGRLMQDALTADLILRLPPDRVIFPALPKPVGAVGLRVDVLDFRADASGARLEASWLVTAPAAPQPDVGPAAGTVPAASVARSIVLEGRDNAEGPAATAHALAQLLARLADVIVARMNDVSLDAAN
jgi:uncharacterized lipoprotein YmbA